MNARDNTPLRAQIADRLAAGEDTAAGIAQAIGKGDTPSIVVKELNAMRTDGQVECAHAKRGKKNGLVYWLVVPRDVAAASAQPEVAKNTGSSASGSLSPSEGAAVQSKPAPVAAATPSAAPVAADETQDDDEMPPADASLLALANRELSDRLARVAHVLRGSGLEGLKDLDDGADLQSAAAALTGAYQTALAESATLRRKIIERDSAMEIMDAQVVAASETLAPLVLGDIDTSDMGLQELAEKVAAVVDERGRCRLHIPETEAHE